MPIMKTFKKRVTLFAALLVFWFALTGTYGLRELISGVLATCFTIVLYEWLLRHARIKPMKPMPKVRWLKLFKIMIVSILKSAWHHIFRIISGNEEIIFIQVALETDHPYANLLIANVITLTPGAVSVEVDKELLKILCYAPKTTEEHQEIYQLLEDLQSVFREDSV